MPFKILRLKTRPPAVPTSPYLGRHAWAVTCPDGTQLIFPNHKIALRVAKKFERRHKTGKWQYHVKH